jgi:hypothetical protein
LRISVKAGTVDAARIIAIGTLENPELNICLIHLAAGNKELFLRVKIQYEYEQLEPGGVLSFLTLGGFHPPNNSSYMMTRMLKPIRGTEEGES